MSEVLNNLSLQKQQLERDIDSGIITYDEYKNRKKDVEEQILVEREKILSGIVDRTQIMPQQIKKVKKRRGPKVKKDSYISLIIKALMSPEVKSCEDAMKKVDEWKPGRDRDKLEAHIKRIIYNVRKNTGTRWEKYEWDKDNYMLIEKKEDDKNEDNRIS